MGGGLPFENLLLYYALVSCHRLAAARAGPRSPGTPAPRRAAPAPSLSPHDLPALITAAEEHLPRLKNVQAIHPDGSVDLSLDARAASRKRVRMPRGRGMPIPMLIFGAEVQEKEVALQAMGRGASGEWSTRTAGRDLQLKFGSEFDPALCMLFGRPCFALPPCSTQGRPCGRC